MEDLNTPLIESAQLARELSRKHCNRDGHSEDSCDWYHGVWQYLRLFGLVAAPDRHAAFFHRAITAAISGKQKSRLLISGTADYAMLAHVIRATSSIEGESEITALDRCRTPLTLCSWYADRLGVDIETVAIDLLAYQPERKFDAICTHSFLPQFSREMRPKILACWSNLLGRDGRLITNVSIRQNSPEGRIKIDQQDIDRFCEKVRQAAENFPSLVGDVDELLAQARVYCARRTSYSFRSDDEVIALFESSGFSIAEINAVEVGGTSPVSGPGISRSSRYLELVAIYNND